MAHNFCRISFFVRKIEGSSVRWWPWVNGDPKTNLDSRNRSQVGPGIAGEYAYQRRMIDSDLSTRAPEALRPHRLAKVHGEQPCHFGNRIGRLRVGPVAQSELPRSLPRRSCHGISVDEPQWAQR